MTRTTRRIKRTLTAIALSATAALLVAPMGHAGNTAVDDWFRDATAVQSRPASQPLDLTGDYMFQQYFRNAAKASDHVLDVSARDAVLVPASAPSDHILDVSARDAVLVPASISSDHILDVSARDSRTSAAVVSESSGGTDWGEIGVRIALTLGGALLLVVLVAVGVEVRHARHRLGSV